MGTATDVINHLSRYGVKQETATRWRANRPVPGSDSQSVVIEISDEEHGTYYSHHDSSGGSLYELARQLGIEPTPPERKPAEETKRAYRDLADYARAHGVEASVFEAAKWEPVTRSNRPALRFPTKSGYRYRYLDGNKPVFNHDTGYTSCWYGLAVAVDVADANDLPLVLCNGEPSVVVAHSYGVPAACMTSSGEKELPETLTRELADAWRGGRILIALDCDTKGREASVKLVTQLNGLGFKASSVDLGLTDGGDLADFCKLYRDASLAQLIRLPTEKAPEPTPEQKEADNVARLTDTLQSLNAAMRRDKALRDPEHLRMTLAQGKALIEQLEQADGVDLLVEGEDVGNQAIQLYMQRKALKGAMPGLPTGFRRLDQITDGLCPGLNVLIGATGMGKSWMAVSVAGYLVRRGYHGVVVGTEMLPTAWINRVAAYLSGIDSKGIRRGSLTTDQEARYADALNAADARLSFVRGVRPTAAAMRATILKAKASRPVDFVIVDSASRLIAPGENYAGATAAVQDALQELVLETALPFLVTGQVRGRDIANRTMKMPTIVDSLGGSSWENNADVLVGLYYHHYYVKQGMADFDPEYPEGVFTMRVLKNREGENMADSILKMKFVGGCGLYELDDQKPLPAGSEHWSSR